MQWMTSGRCALALACLCGLGGAAQARDWTVGAGQTWTTPAGIDWARVQPGDRVLVLPGSYRGNLTLSGVQGTATLPIRVQASNPADPPRLLDGAALRGSAWVELSDLDLSVVDWADLPVPTRTWPALLIDGGSQQVALRRSRVHDARIGVAVQDAGAGIVIEANTIEANGYHGLIVSEASASARVPSRISGNLVRDNGQHGIELQSSWWRVERNKVLGNGAETRVAQPAGGTSGIHLFNHAGVAAGCSHNRIRYNFVSGQVDRRAADGNGIHMDHFCSDNEVAFNVSWGNDGPGIGLYASAGNQIHHNTVFGNHRDLGRASRLPGVIFGELLFTSAPQIEGVATAAAARDNRVWDNLVVSTLAHVPALNVDFIVTDDPNQFGPNLLHHALGAPVLNYGGWLAQGADAVGQFTATSGNLVEPVAFSDARHPLRHGLKPLQPPSSAGLTPEAGQRDLLKALPAGHSSWFGAYYTGP